MSNRLISNRRDFLKFLAASPLVTALPGRSSEIITSPKNALNVFDFEAAARQALPPAHFGYLATGVELATCDGREQARHRGLGAAGG